MLVYKCLMYLHAQMLRLRRHLNTYHPNKLQSAPPLPVSVVSASLGALATWVEWTPMQNITGSNVVDACAFFLDSVNFRLQGLEVLKQVRGPRQCTVDMRC